MSHEEMGREPFKSEQAKYVNPWRAEEEEEKDFLTLVAQYW